MKYSEAERLAFAKGMQEVRPVDRIHRTARIHGPVSIGEDGFGWVRQEDGTLYKMPHAGRVVIEENVEIASFVTIDRAVIGETIIGAGSKLDHHTHIGHGAKIGKNCLIVGAGIGGSAEIGDNCFIGHRAVVRNKVKIGNNVTIGQGSNVINNIPDGETWAGNPARKL